MLLRDTAPPERRSAQVIYPAAFHTGRVETPNEWADEALRQHQAEQAAERATSRNSPWPTSGSAIVVSTPTPSPREWANRWSRTEITAFDDTSQPTPFQRAQLDWLIDDVGAATPVTPVDFRQDPHTGQLEATGFGAGLAFQGRAIVAPLPQPPRGWLARIFGAR